MTKEYRSPNDSMGKVVGWLGTANRFGSLRPRTSALRDRDESKLIQVNREDDFQIFTWKIIRWGWVVLPFGVGLGLRVGRMSESRHLVPCDKGAGARVGTWEEFKRFQANPS